MEYSASYPICQNAHFYQVEVYPEICWSVVNRENEFEQNGTSVSSVFMFKYHSDETEKKIRFKLLLHRNCVRKNIEITHSEDWDENLALFSDPGIFFLSVSLKEIVVWY